VCLDLVVIVVLLTPDVPGRILRAGMGPVVSLDLFLFLRGAALVLHVLLQLERVETSLTRRPIQKNLPSMPEIKSAALRELLGQLTEESTHVAGHPAAGAAAALVAGLAASLAAGAADRSREVWEEAAGARAQALALGRRAAILVERARVQYAQARKALEGRQPETKPPDEVRDWALGVAIRSAADPPIDLAGTAADIAELSAEVALRGADDVRADAVVAADLAATVARSAATLVRVNLVVGGDSEAAAQAANYADAASRAAELAAKSVS
jgi:formiminotetrahydrofolate cyclodeaminase